MGQVGVEAIQTVNMEAMVAPERERSAEDQQEAVRKTGHRGLVATFTDPANQGHGIRREGLGPVRKTGVNNQFDLPQEPAYPVPRDTEESNPLAWQKDGLCSQTDPEAFFPEQGGSTRDAKKVCASCDVQSECLDYALRNDERFGIWGGLSERERRKLKRRAA